MTEDTRIDGEFDFLTELVAIDQQAAALATMLQRSGAEQAAIDEIVLFRRSLIGWSLPYAHFRIRLLRVCTAYEFWEIARIIPARLWAELYRFRSRNDVRFCHRFAVAQASSSAPADRAALCSQMLRLLDWAMLYQPQFAALLEDARRGQNRRAALDRLQAIEQALCEPYPESGTG